MKILVPVKQVPDPNALRFDTSGHFAASTPREINEYDSYALEAAIQLRESGAATEVVVMTVGATGARDAVNRGLAMGADRGVHVTSDGLTAAQVAAAIVVEAQNGYDAVIVGQETSDGGTGNVGPTVAAHLGFPLVSNVVELAFSGGSFALQREVEDGRHIVEVDTPVVICVLTGLNDPRSPSLKGIMAARRKAVEERAASDTADAAVAWGNLYAEERRAQGVIIDDADPAVAAQRLVELLREKKAI